MHIPDQPFPSMALLEKTVRCQPYKVIFTQQGYLDGPHIRYEDIVRASQVQNH